MDGTPQRYIESCPIGCNGPLETTDIALPEGNLLRCPECGQFVSQITTEAYRASMERFDEANFNRPAGRELERRHSVARRRLALCALVIVFFFCGGVFGAWLFARIGYAALYLPAAVTGITGMAYWAYRQRMRGRPVSTP